MGVALPYRLGRQLCWLYTKNGFPAHLHNLVINVIVFELIFFVDLFVEWFYAINGAFFPTWWCRCTGHLGTRRRHQCLSRIYPTWGWIWSGMFISHKWETKNMSEYFHIIFIETFLFCIILLATWWKPKVKQLVMHYFEPLNAAGSSGNFFLVEKDMKLLRFFFALR